MPSGSHWNALCAKVLIYHLIVGLCLRYERRVELPWLAVLASALCLMIRGRPVSNASSWRGCLRDYFINANFNDRWRRARMPADLFRRIVLMMHDVPLDQAGARMTGKLVMSRTHHRLGLLAGDYH